MEGLKTARNILLLLLIASFVFLWNAQTGSLTSWDEAFYAQVSREMLMSGNYLDLTWRGQPWFDKPPLYMWATVFFYKLFGVNEFTVRLFSALCAIGTILIVYLFCNKLYSRHAASAASLILLSTWHFIWAGKVGMLDAAVTFFITLSIFLFKLGEDNQVYLFFSGITFSLAFLTKSFAALVVPVTILLYIIFTKRFWIFKKPGFWFGVIASLIILGWWYAQVFIRHHEVLSINYFRNSLFVNTIKGVDSTTGSIFNYLEVIPNKGRPWAAMGLFALLYAMWRIIINNRNKDLMLPMIWALTVLVVFSVVKTKLHWYMVPIYPSLAILIGWGFSKIFKKITVFVVLVFVFASLLYLSSDKKIFNLDYSPEIKKISLTVKNIIPENETVYLYNIEDPGIQFYCGDIRKNVYDRNQLEGIIKENNRYIIFDSEGFKPFSKEKFLVIIKTPNFIVVKTK